MLAAQRRKLIVSEVQRHGGVRVTDLAALLDVSEMTVRRDLEALNVAGLLERVHGGATLSGELGGYEPGFEAKSHRQTAEKDAIAETARSLVRPGQVVGLSAGTTTWRLAHHLLDVPDLTVVTNSIQVANVLYREPRGDLTVVLTGGLRTPSDALVGPLTVDAIRKLHLDMLFLGVHGIAVDAGLTTPNLLEAATNRALVDSAADVVVLADHAKWGVRALSHFADLDEVAIVISDHALPEEAQMELSARVKEVLLAESSTVHAGTT